MATWTYDPNQYEEQDFAPIPEGNHRVRIADVVAKTFNSGKDGYEITLSVSGKNSKLWYYLVLNPDEPKKTNQRIGSFFDSFGITNYDMSHYRGWVGKIGAVNVKHEEYNGNTQAKVAWCVNRSKQDALPAWQEPGGGSAPAGFTPMPEIDESDLPFA